MTFSVGVDSYSYHRLLGAIRPGEFDPGERIANGGTAVLDEVRMVGADYVSLETMFIESPAALASTAFREASEGLRVGLSWGGNDGFAFGDAPEALEDFEAWLGVASAIGTSLIRVVVGGPRLRGSFDAKRCERTAHLLRQAVDRASASGVALALENHGDLTADEISELMLAAGQPEPSICLDSANAFRVGDDVLEMTERFLPNLAMVHLKDCLLDIDDPVAGPVSVAYGEGVVPVAALLDRLIESGFAGPVCVELGQLDRESDERDLVRQGVSWLRERRRAASATATAPNARV